MSRLKPTLEYFKDTDKEIKLSTHNNLTLFRRVPLRDQTPEILREFRDVVKKSMDDLKYQMLDRTFYYYDTKENSNQWIRVFEHLNSDIAVIVNMDYMFYEDNPILSFPNSAAIYNNDAGELKINRYEFGVSQTEHSTEMYHSDVEYFEKILFAGAQEVLFEVTKEVYAL